MRELAPGVFALPGFPPYSINAYLIGDVLVDAGVRQSRWSLLRQLRGRTIRLHVLTHAHPDHQGASHAVCTELGVPLWCGERDANAMEIGEVPALLPPLLSNRLLDWAVSGPAHPVARRLREGDIVGDFEVIETPGHSPGHISYWRERDRVLILGDVLRHQNPLTFMTELGEPYSFFTCDVALNRASIRKVAALRPQLVCFGHGPPLRDSAQLEAFAASL